jgi:hypothetical protein
MLVIDDTYVAKSTLPEPSLFSMDGDGLRDAGVILQLTYCSSMMYIRFGFLIATLQSYL